MTEIPKDVLAGWTVLVVEDDPFSLDVATIILTHYGAVVHTAEDGAKGLAAAQSLKPSFILSDISMPGMDGWMFIKAVKSDPRTAAIPVIALTANVMKGYRERAMAAGFHNFLTKPLTPETFIKDLLVLLVDIPELKSALNLS